MHYERTDMKKPNLLNMLKVFLMCDGYTDRNQVQPDLSFTLAEPLLRSWLR